MNFWMGIVVMQMQAGLSGWAPHLHPRVCMAVYKWAKHWSAHMGLGYCCRMRSASQKRHLRVSLCVYCRWYIMWYHNWNSFLPVAKEHTKWNSGINDVTGNSAICLWMAFCFFASLGRSVSMLSLFVLLFPKYEKNQKGNDKNPEFSLFFKLFLISWFVIQSCYCGRPKSYPGVVSMHKKFKKKW